MLEAVEVNVHWIVLLCVHHLEVHINAYISADYAARQLITEAMLCYMYMYLLTFVHHHPYCHIPSFVLSLDGLDGSSF